MSLDISAISPELSRKERSKFVKGFTVEVSRESYETSRTHGFDPKHASELKTDLRGRCFDMARVPRSFLV